MTDWADEIAKTLSPMEQRCDMFHCVFPDNCHCITDIAAALRKAKAEGMREAAIYFENLGSENNDEAERRWAAAQHIYELAAKLETPTE